LKGEIVQRLQRLLTLPAAELPPQVEALLGERDGLRRELKRWRRLEMDRQVVAASAESGSVVIREFSDDEPADLRYFASTLMAAGKHVLACRRSEPPYVVIGRGSGDFDLRTISARIFALLKGKGGGSPALLEGRAGDLAGFGEVGELLRRSLQGPPGPRP
jgi:alanyl-tRNA synthetase